jgi:hypothetical protein
MTATITPIHSRQTSTRSETVMLFGNPPAVTPIHHRQTSTRSGTVMAPVDEPAVMAWDE